MTADLSDSKRFILLNTTWIRPRRQTVKKNIQFENLSETEICSAVNILNKWALLVQTCRVWMTLETDSCQARVSVPSALDFGRICADDSFYGPGLQMFIFTQVSYFCFKRRLIYFTG